MISWEDIQRRLAAGEDEHTEFKRGSVDFRSIGRSLAAFANTAGGLLILGVDDAGAVLGVKEDAEQVSERLTSFLQTGLNSPVQAQLGRHHAPEGWIHWLAVPRQRGYEPLAHDSRVFVRRGRANVQPSAAELQDLYNLFGYLLTEERAIAAAGLDAIDQQAFHSYLERQGLDVSSEPQPDIVDDLLARGVLARVDADSKATLYGVLAFGRAPQSYAQTHNFWIECVAYHGVDRADSVFLTGEAKGRLDEQVDRAVGWVQGLGRFEHYEGVDRKDTPLVPPAVIREAIVNAVAHRDYAITGSKILLEVFTDRLELTSPGRLPNGITIQSVTRGGNPRSRNESMANYLVVMRKMEQRGRGWPVMRRVMREHNGTEPELMQDTEVRFVRVTLRLAQGGR